MHSLGKVPIFDKKEQNVNSSPIILYFHGDSFCDGNTQMHENYLREWAKLLDGVPILSIDYRLAPSFTLPNQFLECYHVYEWLISSSKLGISISKIAIAGDGMGANLAISVAIKASFQGLKIPDGILLEYPMLDLTSTVYPSRLLFMEDPIINWNTIKTYRDALIPNSEFDVKDPYISPLYASDHHLSQLPSGIFYFFLLFYNFKK
jgi:acetyl esterase/lipase